MPEHANDAGISPRCCGGGAVEAYVTNRLAELEDERVTIERATESGPQAEVDTIVVIHGGERVPMGYWLHQVESAWRVHELSIECVSLVTTTASRSAASS